MSDYGSVAGVSAALDGAVLRLTLDRPTRRNALDDIMMGGLIEALDAGRARRAGAGRGPGRRRRPLLRRGRHRGPQPAGPGPDGSTERPRAGSIQRRLPSTAHRLIRLMTSVQVPIVCRVQGWAAGIGFQLALALDFTVAADDARFWEPFTERGFTPDSGATWLLPRRSGEVRARQLLLLGRRLDRGRGGRLGPGPSPGGRRPISTAPSPSWSSSWPPDPPSRSA